MTKNALFVLNRIRKLGCINQLKSATISNIIKDLKLSQPTVRASINDLMEEGYVKEGFRQKNAKTYYITEEGAKFVTEIMSDIIEQKEKEKSVTEEELETEELLQEELDKLDMQEEDEE